MKQIASVVKVLIVFVFLAGVGIFMVTQYSFIFSRKVTGVIQDVERIDLNVSLMQTGQQKISPQLYSFAVAVKEKSGEIVTASAEDRQWAVVHKGQCVEARFYPYPPWNLSKGGTFYNARLDRLWDCATTETAEPKGQ